MSGLLFYSLFGLASLALLRWLVSSCRVHWKTWQVKPGLVQSILLGFASALHLTSIGAWLLMALTTLGAFSAQLNPGGPAPYFLLPWFTGFFIMGIANFFADGLNALVRRDYAHLLHSPEQKQPNEEP